MNRSKAIGLGLGSAIAVAALAVPSRADVKANPYEAIVERNPFGLKPAPLPPPPQDPNANQPPAPLVTVEVTGITSMFSTPKVLLEIVPGPGKPPIKPILSAGERVDSIEVVSIDVEKAEVVIKNGNVTTNLSLKVAKAPSGPAAPVPGGAVPIKPPVPAAYPTPTGASLGGQSSYGSGRGSIVLSGGNPSVPAAPVNPAIGYGGANPASFGAGGVPPAAYGGAAAAASVNAGAVDNSLRSIPSRTIRSSGPGTTFQNPTAKPLSGEEQYLLMKASELNARQRGVPHPPTPSLPGAQDLFKE